MSVNGNISDRDYFYEMRRQTRDRLVALREEIVVQFTEPRLFSDDSEFSPFNIYLTGIAARSGYSTRDLYLEILSSQSNGLQVRIPQNSFSAFVFMRTCDQDTFSSELNPNNFACQCFSTASELIDEDRVLSSDMFNDHLDNIERFIRQLGSQPAMA